jgi:hypothetical protein
MLYRYGLRCVPLSSLAGFWLGSVRTHVDF